MNILQNLKSYLVENKIVEDTEVFFDYDEFSLQDRVVLSVSGGESCFVGQKTNVLVSVKNALMKNAFEKAEAIFSALCPPGNYEKPLKINGSVMLVKSKTPPAFKEKTKSGKFSYTFEILVISSR